MFLMTLDRDYVPFSEEHAQYSVLTVEIDGKENHSVFCWKNHKYKHTVLYG